MKLEEIIKNVTFSHMMRPGAVVELINKGYKYLYNFKRENFIIDRKYTDIDGEHFVELKGIYGGHFLNNFRIIKEAQ